MTDVDAKRAAMTPGEVIAQGNTGGGYLWYHGYHVTPRSDGKRLLAENAALIQQRDALRTALGALVTYKNRSAEWKEMEDPSGSYLHILFEQADTALALPNPDAGDTDE